jgi:hypothetical protein
MTQSGLLAFARRVHRFEDRETALELVVDEVQSATGAAWVAAYTRDTTSDGFSRSAAAGEVPFATPDRVNANDPVLSALRAACDAIDAPKSSVLAGTVVLPFVTADGIVGLLDVGPALKPYSETVRSALAAVGNAVGLALAILDGRSMRKDLEHWRDRAKLAEGELTVLHQALAGASRAAAWYSEG